MTTGYLADTHVVLWSWHRPEALPEHFASILASDFKVHVSVASIWEMSIKAGSGKLKTVDNIAGKLELTGFSILPIEPRHAEAVRNLPHHHRDPFDRMLIAQAMAENLSILTVDGHFLAYGVSVI